MTITRAADRTGFTMYSTPLQSLGRTALISGALGLLPFYAALLWLTEATGALPVVLEAEAILTVLLAVVYVRYRFVFAAVTPTALVKRRMVLPGVRVDRSLIDHVALNRVYRGASTEALTQMLVLDAEGRRLFGMSGLFWSRDDLRAIADALDVQVIVDDIPVSRADYYAMFPMARSWYATRAFRLAAIGVAAIVATGTLASIQHVLQR